nr:MAG TPA: hypothetical protein [Caudoviricetes sp.]
MMTYLVRLSIKLCGTSSECYFNYITYSTKLIRYILARGFCYIS